MEKSPKILIITYYWPPAGGIAVKRWLSLSNQFAGLNAEVHVLTLEKESAEYHSIDAGLLDSVDSRISVHRIRAWNPFQLTKKLFKKHIPPQGFSLNTEGQKGVNLLTRLRSNLFIPDPRKTWNNQAVKKALEIVDSYGIDTIITTSPPHSVQLIGKRVAHKSNVKWVADFRDPWTDIFYYEQLGHSLVSRKIDRRLERCVLDKANAVTTVSWGFQSLLHGKVSHRNLEDFHVIPNGIDGNILSPKAPDLEQVFRVVYTGMLTDIYEIEPFLESVASHNASPGVRLIQFDFYGSVPPHYQQRLERTFSFIHFHGNRSMEEIPGIQQAADGLFLAGPKQYNSGHIPGKLFEYLRASRSIFYLGEEESDVHRILHETDSGRLFNRKDVASFPAILGQEVKRMDFNLDEEDREEKLSSYFRTHQAKDYLRIVQGLHSK